MREGGSVSKAWEMVNVRIPTPTLEICYLLSDTKGGRRIPREGTVEGVYRPAVEEKGFRS